MKRSYLLIGAVTLFLTLMAWVWNMPDSYVVENSQEEVKTTVTNTNERNVKVVNTTNKETKENLTKVEDSNVSTDNCIFIMYLTYDGTEKSGFIKEVNLEEFTWEDNTFYTFTTVNKINVYESEFLENSIGTVYKGGWLWNIKKITATEIASTEENDTENGVEPFEFKTRLAIDKKAENKWEVKPRIFNAYRKEIIISMDKKARRKLAYNKGRARSFISSNSSSTSIVTSNVAIVNGNIIEGYTIVSFSDNKDTINNTFNNIAIKKETESKKIYMPIVGIVHI